MLFINGCCFCFLSVMALLQKLPQRPVFDLSISAVGFHFFESLCQRFDKLFMFLVEIEVHFSYSKWWFEGHNKPSQSLGMNIGITCNSGVNHNISTVIHQ